MLLKTCANGSAIGGAYAPALSGYVAYTSLDVYTMFHRRWVIWDGWGSSALVWRWVSGWRAGDVKRDVRGRLRREYVICHGASALRASPPCRAIYKTKKSVSKGLWVGVLTLQYPASRGLATQVPPLLIAPRTSIEVYANALDALALYGGRLEAGVHWHLGDELARLERASGRCGGS